MILAGRLAAPTIAVFALAGCANDIATQATTPNTVAFQFDGVAYAYTLPAGYCRVSTAEPRHAWLFSEIAQVAVVHVVFVRCDEVAATSTVSSFGTLTTPDAVKDDFVPPGAPDFRARFGARADRPIDGTVDTNAFAAAVQRASTEQEPELFGPISLDENFVSFSSVRVLSGQKRMGIGVMAVMASRPFGQHLIAPLATPADLERQNVAAIEAIKSVRRAGP